MSAQRRSLVILTVLALLTGCGEGGLRRATPPPAASPTSPAEPSGDDPSGVGPSGVEPSGVEPSPTELVPVDGRNLAACADGTCTVEIAVGDVIRFRGPIAGRIPSLTVVDVGPGGVHFAVSSGTIIGGSGRLTLNDVIVVTTGASDGRRAVVRIEPAG